MRFSLIRDENSATVTVYKDGEVYTANLDHPNFEAIVGAIMADDDVDVDLFDVSKKVAARFERLSERVSVAGGHVYFDGDEVNTSLSKQIVRFMAEGVEDFQPLVNFMEKLAQNPSERSREQLYDWLTKHEFTINADGDFVGYKGVDSDGNGGFQSCHSGPAIVNGESVNGYVPNNVGSTVEIARSQVDDDPHSACSTGLHVGNWRYADSFASHVLKVTVNPRDVVSVPHDSNSEKIRCCRYVIVEASLTGPVTTALDTSDYSDDNDDEYDDDFDSPEEDESEQVEAEENDEYAGYTLRELRVIAQARNIRVDGRRPSYCTKPELLAALAGS